MRRAMLQFMTLGLAIASSHCQETNAQGSAIIERFIPPQGFSRQSYAANSFQDYIRHFPLKAIGSPVLLYNGEIKRNSAHVSVFDMPLLKQDLIQCADAVIKIRAEYLYSSQKFNDIKFTISNGMEVPFSRFAEGYRVSVKGSATAWVGGYQGGTGRTVFNEYLTFIYMYAGTYSLSREVFERSLPDISVGDFFIFGGSPGHVVMVVDLAVNTTTGDKIMLLAQSYMPSQEFHILKSFSAISPWYYVKDEALKTPEWNFAKGSLKRF